MENITYNKIHHNQPINSAISMGFSGFVLTLPDITIQMNMTNLAHFKIEVLKHNRLPNNI